MKAITRSKKVLISFVIILIAVISVITAIVVSSSGDKKSIKDKLALGEKYLTEMKYEEAIIAFEEVISIEPRSIDGYLGLADAYIGLKQPEKAVESLERGIFVVEQVYEDEGIIIDQSEELFLKEYTILVELRRIEDAIKKLVQGYELTGSALIKNILDQYTSTEVPIFTEEKPVQEEQKSVLTEEDQDGFNQLIQLIEGENYAEASKYCSAVNMSGTDQKIQQATYKLRRGIAFDGNSLMTKYSGVGITYNPILPDSDYASYVYYGDLVNGIANGHGVSINSNGDGHYEYYVGQWENGLPNGEGYAYCKLNGGYFSNECQGVFSDGRLMKGTYNDLLKGQISSIYVFEEGLVQSVEHIMSSDYILTIYRNDEGFEESDWEDDDNRSYTVWSPYYFEEIIAHD